MERPDEVRALARLGAAELGGATGGIGGIHDAVARRVFGALGPTAAPVRAAHDAIARSVYGGLRGGATLVGQAADRALARRDAGDGRAISSRPRGAQALAVLSGLHGDALERDGSPLQAPMAVRLRGRVVGPAAFRDPAPRLVVFLHGLMETEYAWRLGGRRSYGERLARDLGVTPLEVRYNTGRHISENGRSLAALLEEFVAAWPVDVREIALVGHSMGGLVARSACHHGAEREMAWVAHVRHIVSLGSPHHGAPLAQGVHYAAHALHAVPETRPFGRFLRRRSAGIRDTRQGSLVDRDWSGCDPDALRAAACTEVPLLDGATHCFVSATIARDERHPLGRLLGDALVLPASASGRRIPLPAEHGLRLGGASHIALLNHPAVYAQLRAWLQAAASDSSSRSLPASVRTSGS
jgi:pimeloyl-ACP methyl ester carboxylesterase